jgi:hypothetical protein
MVMGFAVIDDCVGGVHGGAVTVTVTEAALFTGPVAQALVTCTQ